MKTITWHQNTWLNSAAAQKNINWCCCIFYPASTAYMKIEITSSCRFWLQLKLHNVDAPASAAQDLPFLKLWLNYFSLLRKFFIGVTGILSYSFHHPLKNQKRLCIPIQKKMRLRIFANEKHNRLHSQFEDILKTAS